jgi:hypothetical protein
MNTNELIEKFWIKHGGKPHMKEDLWFYESDWSMLMPILDIICSLGCIIEVSYSLVCVCRIVSLNGKGNKAESFINDSNGGKSSQSAVYNTIVEYINYHNENSL